MHILAIESSCDDTSAAVLTDEVVRSNVIADQAIHIQFGGVVPELASRAHQQTISQTVQQALNEAGLQIEDIDQIAVTQGPGLMGSLLVGVCFAKGLALAHSIPIVGVNHMDAHVYANFIDQQPAFPLVGLTVSGGHTQLLHIEAPFKHVLLGSTRDDAAGEAFDKIGKMLGLPYPAGPVIDQLAQNGNPAFHSFPKALLNEGLDFSFSGLKTSVLYYLEDKSEEWIQEHLTDLCASVSEAITEVLTRKLERAIRQTGVCTALLAGGVSANSMLRIKARAMADQLGIELYSPPLSYCTDNAAMIGITGWMKVQHGAQNDLSLRPFASI
ncbi:MAG: tRNA (adenosine(37)-N6)-threonylcarbamoyltransferase complex transferase subunit TsaD [Bacteroidota bacterium]